MTWYYAVAPVFTSGVPAEVHLPVDLGNGVRLDRLPPIYGNYVDEMTRQVGTFHTAASGGLALVSDYEADCMDAPDPSPPGRPRSMADAAGQAIQIGSLSTWLAQPTDLSFCLIAVLSEKIRPRPIVYPPLHVPEGFVFGVLTPERFVEARTINERLFRLSTRTTAWVATRYLWFALHEEAIDLAYGILSIAIEALVGPEDFKDLTHRIPRRGAALLGGGRSDQCLTHVRLAKWWKARCDVMHGETLEKHADVEKKKLLGGALELVRLGIRKILLDPAVAAEFVSFPTRDAYLERIGAGFADPTPAEQAAAEAKR
ncbi:MAG: hypothetical protein ACHQPI_11565 [Thermoanaerobaculia bacterium]